MFSCLAFLFQLGKKNPDRKSEELGLRKRSVLMEYMRYEFSLSMQDVSKNKTEKQS